MNILYISSEYPPETGFGGIGTYTLHSAEGMANRGHHVHVICRSLSSTISRTLQNGVEVHRIPPGTFPLPAHPLCYPFRKLCYALIPNSLVRLAWAREVFRAYQNIVKENVEFDIIEFPDCGAEGYYFPKKLRVPRIVRFHTPWVMVRKLDKIRENIADQLVQNHIEQRSAKNASAASSPTHALATIISSKWHIKPIATFPNPLPLRASIKTVGKDWIFIGRVEHRKGVHILLEAYSRLCQEQSPPSLWLIGKPFGCLHNGEHYGHSIEKQIEASGCSHKIHWIKGVSPQEVSDHLQKASVAIFPSLWENLSYSCLEAMEQGLTVVASRCGGFQEIIEDGINGLLFEPGNIDDLTQTLSKLFDNSELSPILGAHARKSIESVYNAKIVCEKMDHFYQSLIPGVSRGKS